MRKVLNAGSLSVRPLSDELNTQSKTRADLPAVVRYMSYIAGTRPRSRVGMRGRHQDWFGYDFIEKGTQALRLSSDVGASDWAMKRRRRRSRPMRIIYEI